MFDQHQTKKKRAKKKRAKKKQTAQINVAAGCHATPLTNFLLSVVDGALIAIIFIAPFFMGGRHPTGRLVYVVLALIAAVAWLLRQCVLRTSHWTRSPADWLVLAGGIVVCVQLLPLPPALLAKVSPSLASTLPLWSGDAATMAAIGPWSQISLAPEATRGGLAVYGALCLILLVTIQRCRELSDVQRVLRWVGMSAILMASFGIVQWVMSNGKFVWLYEHPFRDTSSVVKGSFINKNHFAHMLALGVGPLMLWIITLLRRQDTSKPSFGAAHRRTNNQWTAFILTLGLTVVLFAGLLTLSRGGAVAIAVALLTAGAVLYSVGWIEKRYLGGLVGMVAVIAAALMIYGHDRVANRLDDLTSGSVDTLDRNEGRRKIWRADTVAIQKSPVWGSGVGSHREVYPMYMPNPPITEYTHAESGYLQVATETGLVGLGLVFLFMIILGRRCVNVLRSCPSHRIRACLGAVLAGLMASAVHSAVDFVWYIPACMTLTAILIACALRLWCFAQTDDIRSRCTVIVPRPAWAAATLILLVVGLSATQNRVRAALASHHWDSYLRESVVVTRADHARMGQEGPDLSFLTGPEQNLHDASMIRHLADTIRHDPTHARAHIRLAAHHLRRFEQLQQTAQNAMDLSQIRDAAIASKFSSREALEEWLGRAVGDHRRLLYSALWHARTGLRLCPLQGEAYLYLARLCFLEGGFLEGGFLEKGDASTRAAYVAQALRLRPYDGEVLFEAGREALLAGDTTAAQAHWKQCFHAGGTSQTKLVKLLAAHVSLMQLIGSYEPDLSDGRMLYYQFRAIASRSEMESFCRWYEQLAHQKRQTVNESSEKLAEIWRFASRMRHELGNYEQAVAGARLACQYDPNEYKNHYALALALLGDQQFEQARKELNWCRQRKPNENELQRLLKKSIAGNGALDITAVAPNNGNEARRQ